MGPIATLSTIDFYGVISYDLLGVKVGKAIAFDAKETENATSFPLKNIHQHQLEYLKLWNEIGGEGFFLIHFKKVRPDHAYITPLELISKYWDDPNGRKSIPISDFQDEWLVLIDDYLEHFNGTTKKPPRSTNDEGFPVAA